MRVRGVLDVLRHHMGALGGTRTPSLLIRSQMLYPLSYERWRVSVYGNPRPACASRVLPPLLCSCPGRPRPGSRPGCTRQGDGAGLENRPADLSPPPCAVRGVALADQVILADRTVDSEGVLRDIGGQDAVGAIDLRGWPGVLDDRQFHRRNLEGRDPPQRPDRGGARHEDRHLPALFGEQLVSEDAASGPADRHALGAESRAQLAQCPPAARPLNPRRRRRRRSRLQRWQAHCGA
jgi:hypothetical protein